MIPRTRQAHKRIQGAMAWFGYPHPSSTVNSNKLLHHMRSFSLHVELFQVKPNQTPSRSGSSLTKSLDHPLRLMVPQEGEARDSNYRRTRPGVTCHKQRQHCHRSATEVFPCSECGWFTAIFAFSWTLLCLTLGKGSETALRTEMFRTDLFLLNSLTSQLSLNSCCSEDS